MEIKPKHNLNVHDKNGKEIHVSDKVKLGDFEGTIAYNKDSCRFIIQWVDGTSRPLDVHIAKQIEVVIDD